MAYRCVTVSASANEDILKKIYQVLNQEDGYFNTQFSLDFIGFQAEVGTAFKINKVPNKVPKNGYFITPYDGKSYMVITSLSFDEGCTDQDFWIIY